MTSVVDGVTPATGTTISCETGSPRPVTPASILASRLERLTRELDETDAVAPSLKTELREITELASGLDPYLGRWTTPESAALSQLAQRTAAQDWTAHSAAVSTGALEREMLSGHVEGQLLKMLVHATQATKVLEIGMFTGYSALAMAEALARDGRVVACEIDSEVATFAQQCFLGSEHGDKIVIRVGPALVTLAELAGAGEVFDLVFIDADKAGYVDYFEAVLETGLLAPDGLICVDNTLMQGQPWLSGESTPNGIAIEQFNQRVAADPRVEQVIIPLRDGLTLIRPVNQEK